MPIASTRKRKNVPKPSTTRRFEKEDPGTEFAPAAPAMARRKARIDRCPNNLGKRFAKSGSRTIRSVPATLRMISGENRRRSSPLGEKLTGMDVASATARQRYLQRNVRFALIENPQIRFTHGGKE